MKRTRTLFAMLLSLIMVVVLAVPAHAAPGTYTITINNSTKDHTYEAYQVFKGDLSDGVLSNIVWGDGVDGENLLSALKSSKDFGEGENNLFGNCTDAADVAKVLSDSFTKDSENLDAFATIVGKHLGTAAGTSVYDNSAYTISDLPAGYYFVKDSQTVTGNDAQTKFILELVKDTEVTPKSGVPTVDKQVLDEIIDAEIGAEDGWGETADHEINETFQFKLVANIPEDADVSAYEHYYINFVDTWSTGVSYDGIVSVMVNNTELDAKKEQYTVTLTNNGMNVTIQDIIPYLGEGNDLAGSTVTVIYNAHLNENAYVNSASGSTENKNTVKLEFSNNPYWDGAGTPDKGETEEDTVWVFTYQVNNTKVDGDNNDPLPGAGFRLYSDMDCDNEIALIYDEGKSAYRPVASGEQGQEMTSATDGKFNIIGLDHGTYYLKETTIPSGYNEMSPNPFTVTIKATHAETNATTASVTLDTEKSTMDNTIKNFTGATLPSTGGIGTTIFYIAGGILAVGAGVLLIVKRRMNAEK